MYNTNWGKRSQRKKLPPTSDSGLIQGASPTTVNTCITTHLYFTVVLTGGSTLVLVVNL